MSCKHRDTPVWAIQVLLWWPKALASLSTAAHATLNTPTLLELSFHLTSGSSKQVRQACWKTDLHSKPSHGYFFSQHLHRVTLTATHQRFPFVCVLHTASSMLNNWLHTSNKSLGHFRVSSCNRMSIWVMEIHTIIDSHRILLPHFTEVHSFLLLGQNYEIVLLRYPVAILSINEENKKLNTAIAV